MKTPMNELGRLIDRVRRERGMTYMEVAKACGYPSHSTIYNLVYPRQPLQGMPQRKTLERVAAGLGVPLRELRQAAFNAAGEAR
jgi:transcriptional regulator with XRE-family HTH domain